MSVRGSPIEAFTAAVAEELEASIDAFGAGQIEAALTSLGKTVALFENNPGYALRPASDLKTVQRLVEGCSRSAAARSSRATNGKALELLERIEMLKRSLLR